MKIITKFNKAWKSKTPLFWKLIVGASAFVVVAIPIMASIDIPNVPTPEWFTANAWTVMGIATAISVFAKTRTKKEVK